MRTLTRDEARRFYDRIGRGQDAQAFYEDRANDDLVEHSRFPEATSVFEFGCGTGRFAARLLGAELPETASYRAVDLSPRMVRIARERLEPFGARAGVDLTQGEPRVEAEPDSFDRFVSTYVFDLLSEDDCAALVAEAGRVLRPGGLLCLVSLSHGDGAVPRAVARLWSLIHSLRPGLVGGCRPLDLLDFVPGNAWEIRHHRRLSAFGLPSEVLVAALRSDRALDP